MDGANRQSLRLARTHYENFTVLSLLLPRPLRQDVANLYAYCRTVDDLGDEASGSRLELLAQWEQDLHLCWSSTPQHPVLKALQSTIRKHSLPMEPFLRLIEANRIDQVRQRYQTWDELLHYCTYSANPVGRMYLHLLGYRDEHRKVLSDATCTALQLVNFWQDISRDARKGRIYIPREELELAGITESDVLEGRNTTASADMVAHLCNRTANLFDQGLNLLKLLPPRHAYNVRLFSLGGMAVLRMVEQERARIMSHRPSLHRLDKWGLAMRSFTSKGHIRAPRVSDAELDRKFTRP